MREAYSIAVIIPALNEARSIAQVLEAIPDWVDVRIVADNGSTDNTAQIAEAHGARVIAAPRRGYGAACLAGMAALESPDIVVFLDGDFSDHPDQMERLVAPIIDRQADLVIGSRVLGIREKGALTPQARFGNWLAIRLIRYFWGIQYTDLGPFRAVRYATLKALRMADLDYGWTVEMQIKAAIQGARVAEVPVDYRKRIGVSKVSGTVRGIAGAGYKILSAIFLAALARKYAQPARPQPNRLFLFTRYPQPGAAKTRLIPLLGDEGAALLQREMTEFSLDTVKRLRKRFPIDIEVRFEGGDVAIMADWLGGGVDYAPQGIGDLGGRMARALWEAFAAGVEKAVIIGADCPGITEALIGDAFDSLGNHDVTLGPADDGGYYLIGVNRPAAERALPYLFSNVAWGTEAVLRKTLDSAKQRGLAVHQLPELHDVDRPEDIALWRTAQKDWECRKQTPRISVIIPALNEAACIGDTLKSVKSGCNVEIIVADGGSTDATSTIAKTHGATVLLCGRGRARQANEAARHAQGNILLFLHADTRLPDGWDVLVTEALETPGVIAGAFAFATDYNVPVMRPVAALVNFRSRRFQRPYGDQGLFLYSDTFRQQGGYPEIPLMDDLELVRRLARRGRIAILPVPAITSGRRWRNRGILRTMLINQCCVVGNWLGISTQTLATWYRG